MSRAERRKAKKQLVGGYNDGVNDFDVTFLEDPNEEMVLYSTNPDVYVPAKLVQDKELTDEDIRVYIVLRNHAQNKYTIKREK